MLRVNRSNMNGDTGRDTAQWIKLIEEQIRLSDSGDNTRDLNTLYYEFYIHVCEQEGMWSEEE